MSELSTEMEGVAERIAKEYADAEAFDNWMPDVGDHCALIANYREGMSKSGGWMQLACQLLSPDPELNGKDFSIWYRESAPAGILKSAANTLAGKKIETSHEALQVLMDSVGSTINLTVSLDKTGVYKNARITEVVPDAATTAETATA